MLNSSPTTIQILVPQVEGARTIIPFHRFTLNTMIHVSGTIQGGSWSCKEYEVLARENQTDNFGWPYAVTRAGLSGNLGKPCRWRLRTTDPIHKCNSIWCQLKWSRACGDNILGFGAKATWVRTLFTVASNAIRNVGPQRWCVRTSAVRTISSITSESTIDYLQHNFRIHKLWSRASFPSSRTFGSNMIITHSTVTSLGQRLSKNPRIALFIAISDRLSPVSPLEQVPAGTSSGSNRQISQRSGSMGRDANTTKDKTRTLKRILSFARGSMFVD